MAADDGGYEIVAGNERVLRARLSDAKFFWDQDRKRTLESRVDDLKDIVFHAKVGTMRDRVDRIIFVALIAAELLNADIEKVRQAAHLSKSDLITGTVGEFPELQGVMGYYYALNDLKDRAVAEAIRDQYKPQGPTDTVPTEETSIVIAIAEKLDTLVSLWWAGERPTGSKDPFGLRRAALGIVRIILENELRLELVILLFTVLGANKSRQRRYKENELRRALSNSRLPTWIVEKLEPLLVSAFQNKFHDGSPLDDTEFYSSEDNETVSEVMDSSPTGSKSRCAKRVSATI